MAQDTATSATSFCTIAAGVGMFAGGWLSSGVTRSRMLRIMLVLALLGLISAVILTAAQPIAAADLGGATLAWCAMCLMGISQGGMSVVWTVAEEITVTSEHPALLNGIINTFTIGTDAVLQMCFGAILDLHWHGRVDSDGTRAYSSNAYTYAMSLMPALYVMSVLSCGAFVCIDKNAD